MVKDCEKCRRHVLRERRLFNEKGDIKSTFFVDCLNKNMRFECQVLEVNMG